MEEDDALRAHSRELMARFVSFAKDFVALPSSAREAVAHMHDFEGRQFGVMVYDVLRDDPEWTRMVTLKRGSRRWLP